uniref:Uncharacterized protein n=1 Tax=Romanomermis culicivorax TaxID=13658 RepID=A0A915K015_ROMCU
LLTYWYQRINFFPAKRQLLKTSLLDQRHFDSTFPTISIGPCPIPVGNYLEVLLGCPSSFAFVQWIAQMIQQSFDRIDHLPLLYFIVNRLDIIRSFVVVIIVRVWFAFRKDCIV